MTNTSSLRTALQNLSSKKDVISSEALQAKKDLNDYREGDPIQITSQKKFKKNVSTISEFNKSIHLLTSIFKESNFDELASMIAHPTRILVLNFLIGILRGIGFGFGVILIFSFLFYLINTSLPLDISYYFFELLKAIKN